MLTEAHIDTDLESCVNAIGGLISGISEAGKAIAEACKRHPDFIRQLKKRMGTSVSIGYLRRLERLGLGEVCEQVALGSVPHINLVEKLPLADQLSVIARGVKMPATGSDHRMVPLACLSYEEAASAMRGGVIRSVEEICDHLSVRESMYEDGKARHRAEVTRCMKKAREEAELAASRNGIELTIVKGKLRAKVPLGAVLDHSTIEALAGYVSWLH